MKFKYHISQQETVKAFLARHDFSKKTVRGWDINP
ncbi:ribosomal large subunit pseudouridine synthase D [Staphylococcus aureus]|nr:ribosomal large subunit pseudouridine synthase D [Staphylococcus aureus]